MNKKTMLALGTIGATVLPVVSVVSCGGFGDDKKDSVDGGVKAGGSVNQPPLSNYNPASGSDMSKLVESPTEYDAKRKAYETFTVSEETADQSIKGYLKDISSAPRTMKVYDNGLFKIKIEKSLIGSGNVYKDEAMAAEQAKAIASTINIGPAITHLEKGIQILKSSAPASLGGDLGVQVALNNNGQSSTLENIYSITSLVDHEYGHHETLWDYHNFFRQDGLDLAVRHVLTNNGKGKIAKLIADASSYSMQFVKVDKTNWPEDYPEHKNAYNPQIFGDFRYPFGSSEIATRVLNMMSGTTKGMTNAFSVKVNSGNSFTQPAFLTSYATMKFHAKDSIFGNGGKDNTHIKGIFNGWLKEVMGYGQKSIGITVEYNNAGMPVSGLTLADFGDEISKLVLKDSTGKEIKTINVKSFKGLFGYKDELLAKTQAHKLAIPVSSSEEKFTAIPAEGFKLYAYNSKGTEVDLSKFKLNSYAPNKGVWRTAALHVEGTHLVIKK